MSVAVALIGAGLVGRALVERLHGTEIRYLATSRRAHFGDATREGRVAPAALFAETVRALAGASQPVVVDATASDEVAALHADWLARGIHVVTANKAGNGASLARWRRIEAARSRSGASYGDSATVGAGLPVLRALRRLRAAGERLHSLAGSLSGSLAFIADRPDGEPLAARVRAAQQAGLTEPDPAQDLSGEDVARKLLLLARAAGHEVEAHDVRVEPVTTDGFDAVLRDARRQDRVVRHVARIDEDGRCTAALASLDPEHPLAGARGSDLRVAIHSDRYRERPLVLQGAGAGADVTAAALLDDLRALDGDGCRSTSGPVPGSGRGIR
jgi:homoserine dehydrogenase